MEILLSPIKSNFIKILLVVLITYLIPVTDLFAARGCCSKHGGVSSCNASTGYLMCRDGSQSHSCRCKATYGTTPAKKEYKKSTLGTIFGGTSATTPAKTKQKPVSTRGCCRGHGGVSGCDKKSGYLRCKDRSISSTCRCS